MPGEAIVLPIGDGEGDHPKGGGGVAGRESGGANRPPRHLPLHHASHGPPPPLRGGEDEQHESRRSPRPADRARCGRRHRRRARPSRGADPDHGLRRLPFRPPLHRRRLSDAAPRHSRSRGGGRRRGGRGGRDGDETGRPCRHLLLQFLRTLRVLPDRPALALRRRLDEAQAGRAVAAVAGRRAGPPTAQRRRLCRAAARPREWAVAIDPEMPFDRAALLGCAVVTGAGAIFNTAAVRPGEDVAVIGCGGIGLAAVNAARIAGARQDHRRRSGTGEAGPGREGRCHPQASIADADLRGKIVELTQGGVHHAIEAVGRIASGELALSLLRRGGTATIVGMMPLDEKLAMGALELLAEKKLQGSLMGANRFPIESPGWPTSTSPGGWTSTAWWPSGSRGESTGRTNEARRGGKVGSGVR